MSTVILFPGLGASEKLFDRYHFGNRKVVVINFLLPIKNETLQDYCRRIATSIPLDEELIFIGVSFGGILAQEVARNISVKQIFLISSIKSTSEMPRYFSWAKRFPFLQKIPATWIKNIGVLLSEVFTKRSHEERKIFRAFVKNANPEVIRYGIGQTLKWNPPLLPQQIIHIHGSQDLVFPIKKIKADHVIQNGSHFMVIQHSKKINQLINTLLDEGMIS